MTAEAGQNRLDGPSKGRLLIVDDNRDFATALCNVLVLEGYEVGLAHDGDAARTELKRLDAEIILLDLRLEAGSGLDLIAPLKEQVPGLVFIIMTGYAETEAAVEALRRGAYDFLRKPIDDGELLAVLERAFEKNRLEQGKLAAERALRESESLLVHAQDLAHLGSWQIDYDADTVTWSDEVYRIVGLERSEFDGRQATFLDLVHPEDRKRVGQRVEDLIKGEALDFAYRIIRPNGEERAVVVQGVVTSVVDGVPRQARGFIQDITERKKVQEALRESERQAADTLALLSDAIESSPDGIVLYDADDRLVMCNEAYRDMFSGIADFIEPGATYEDLLRAAIARGMVDIPGGDVESYVRARLAHRRESGEGVEVKFTNGFWFLSRERRMQSGGSVGTRSDITTRKHAEIELRDGERRLSLISDNWPGLIGFIDRDMRILFANKTFAVWFGCPREEIVGKTVEELLGPESYAEIRDTHARALAGERVSYEREVTYRDGIPRIVDVSCIPHVDQGDGVEGIYIFAQDVTERRKTKSALRMVQGRFRGIFEQAAVGIGLMTPGGRFLMVNQKLCKLMNRSEEELLQLRFAQFIDPEDLGTALRNTNKLISGEVETYSQIIRFSPEAGKLLWGNLTVSALREAGSDRLALLGIVEDITERVRADEALRESEQKLRGIFETAAIGITATDGNGRYVQSNPAFQKMLGLTAEELSTKSVWDITHPDDHHLEKPKYAELSAGRIASYQIDKRYLHKSGSTIWVNLNVASLKGANGTTIGTIAAIEDITERRRGERALAQSESRLAEAQQLANIGNWEYQFGTRKMVWSDHMLRLYGLDSNTGKLSVEIFLNIVHPDDRAAVKRALREQELLGGQHDYDHRIVLPSGEVRYVQERVEQILDDSGSLIGARGTTQDITERVQAEEQLRQAQKMESVGQLTGGVAHDFNNLLAVIMGNLDLLDEKLENDDIRHAYVEKSLHAVERASSLTQRLLAFSRKQTLSPVIVDVNKLLTGMSDLLTRTLGETVSVRFELATNIWSTLVDEHQLEAAVLNLAINARDAMPSGGDLTLESATVELDQAHAEREGIDPGEYVMIAVSDTGHGIPADMLDHVFEPFYTTKEVGQGSGLGLSMVFGFLKQSDGHAKIYSEVGRGTTVKLYLPRTLTEHVSELDRSEPIVERGTGQVILVVEDDTALLAVAEEALGELGYVALSATNAARALELLDAHPEIELLFTDVVLPGGVNGVELSREALRRRPALKILFTSGYTADAMAHKGALDTGVELMEKPYRKADLSRRMALLLGKN